MSAALALAVHGSSELYADSLERLAKATASCWTAPLPLERYAPTSVPKISFAPSSAPATRHCEPLVPITPSGRAAMGGSPNQERTTFKRYNPEVGLCDRLRWRLAAVSVYPLMDR